MSIFIEIAEVKSDIRELEAKIERAKIEIEAATIEKAGGIKQLGSNEAAQKQALSLAVQSDGEYTRMGGTLQRLQRRRDHLEATKETAEKEYQAERWSTRSRFCDVLERLSYAPPSRFFSGNDIDRVMDDVASDLLVSAGIAGASAGRDLRQQFIADQPTDQQIAEAEASNEDSERRAYEAEEAFFAGEFDDSDQPEAASFTPVKIDDDDDLPF
jgi:hypothetical protein